jgi:hypothetical protein
LGARKQLGVNTTGHMAGLQPQPNQLPAFQHFFRWRETTSRPGIRGRTTESNCTFIPLPQLREYFQDQSRVTKLLHGIFGDDWEDRVDPTLIAEKFPRVFAILLLLSEGSFIQYFTHHEYDLSDDRLPFWPSQPLFPKSPTKPNFLELFREQQWQFCAPTFRYNCDIKLDKEIILPFTPIEILGSGVSATARKIEIDQSYNKLRRGPSSSEVTQAMSPSLMQLC